MVFVWLDPCLLLVVHIATMLAPGRALPPPLPPSSLDGPGPWCRGNMAALHGMLGHGCKPRARRCRARCPLSRAQPLATAATYKSILLCEHTKINMGHYVSMDLTRILVCWCIRPIFISMYDILISLLFISDLVYIYCTVFLSQQTKISTPLTMNDSSISHL